MERSHPDERKYEALLNKARGASEEDPEILLQQHFQRTEHKQTIKPGTQAADDDRLCRLPSYALCMQ